MIHDNTALTVSEEEATRAEEEVKRRLLTSKRLSLVVDLDQTIIHATVDPTVAEWQRDPDNPNYEALKDVRAFQLVDDGPGGRGTWYYIKLRPGLKEFLEQVSKLYELHIYTMGTRAYAQHIAELVDPDRKIFGDRILSRDESGSLVAKNLQRIFPVDTNMVVVIDDRGDVWNWNPNLIKVTQFSFFIGIGDINSSFLPKRSPKAKPPPNSSTPESTTSADATPAGPAVTTSDAIPPEHQQSNQTSSTSSSSPPNPDIPSSALEQLVAMGGGDNPATLQEQTAKQDEALNAQLTDRPLLQMQQKLDAADDSESDSDSEKPRHHLLNDNDSELHWLERSLRKVHTEFFSAYASRMADAKGGRVGELRTGGGGGSKKPSANPNLDLALIPDIKTIMPSLKQRVLSGVAIVFSGIIPLDADVHSAEISIWARSFGARIQNRISSRSTTHVVAARNRTAKVRQAVRKGKGRIKVVGLQWLVDCIVQWSKVDEGPYLLRTEAEDLGRPLPGEVVEGEGEEEVLSESEEVGEGEGTGTDTDAYGTENEEGAAAGPGAGPGRVGAKRQRLRLNIKPPPTATPPVNGTKPLPGSGNNGAANRANDHPAADDADQQQAEAELAALLDPSDQASLENDRSPVGGTNEDWRSMQEEIDAFLGSDAEENDSDTESLTSFGSRGGSVARRSGKRGREDNEGDEGEEEDGGGSGSSADPSPAKKKVKSGAGTSQLAVEVAADRESGLPTPEDEERHGGEGEKRGRNDVVEGGEEDERGDGDGWSDFDDDLEREMERAAAEGDDDDEGGDGGGEG